MHIFFIDQGHFYSLLLRTITTLFSAASIVKQFLLIEVIVSTAVS